VFHEMVSENQLFWGAGDRIVFPWEKDGWQHLYSVPTEGGQATALTPGPFEVEHVSFTDDGREAIFSSNENDIDRRHIWRVAVSSGPARPVTSGEGLEWSPVAAAGGVAYLHSDARRPARAAIQTGAAQHDLAPDTIPADFPADDLVAPKQFLANQGYVVLSINYRSGIGYGLNFREAINYGASGGSEFNDVEGAGLYLRGRDDVDPARIGLWGGSYGGYLTAMGLARASDLFKAGVDFHGVHDWNALRGAVSAPAGTLAAEAAREDAAHLAFESSPMASIKTWRSPVLLIHGDDDRNVAFSETVTLVGALRAQGVYFEQLIIPDEIHGFLRHASWLRAYKASADFFHRKL